MPPFLESPAMSPPANVADRNLLFGILHAGRRTYQATSNTIYRLADKRYQRNARQHDEGARPFATPLARFALDLLQYPSCYC
jgi:hypothetical protein